MTTTVKEKQKAEEKQEEESIKPSDYSCELLLEKTTMEKARDP